MKKASNMKDTFTAYFLLVVVIDTRFVSQVWGNIDIETDHDTIIGIDLGTTYSCVGIYRYSRVEIIANDQGNRITPSYVAFTSDGERLIGDAAKNQITSNPENTVFDVKRLIGRKWNEESVQNDMEIYPFKVVNKYNKPHVQIETAQGQKIFSPEEISAMVLGKMKETAEQFLGKKIKHAVVTVPAYFNFAQRQATKDAGTIAGLNVRRILNEPTAAALAYGFDKKEGKMNILVYDLGGGTFDVSLLHINNGSFAVKSTNGDTHLGGEDFDWRVIDYYIKLYMEKKGKNIKSDPRAVQRLRREVEKGKRILSFAQQVRLEIDSFFGGEDFSEVLTRAKFEELNMDLFRSTVKPVQQVLEDAHLNPEDVNEVVLVGGSTRIPKIQQLVKEFFKGKEPSRDINPDEAVAYGAAINGAFLSGNFDHDDIVLEDVTPLTLGIAVLGGIVSKMIPRNTVIPTKVSRIFGTAEDGQTSITVKVCEGERSMFRDNHFLGSFLLTGIAPAPRGVAQIDITFEIDANGILKVTSVDLGSGSTNEITIQTNENYLSTEEIERMVSEAEKYAAEDKRLLERVNARNKLENYAYFLRNLVNKNDKASSRLSEDDRAKVREAVHEAIRWMESDDDATVDDYLSKIEELKNFVYPITSKPYVLHDEL